MVFGNETPLRDHLEHEKSHRLVPTWFKRILLMHYTLQFSTINASQTRDFNDFSPCFGSFEPSYPPSTSLKVYCMYTRVCVEKGPVW